MTAPPEFAVTFDCDGETLLGVVHPARVSRPIGIVVVVGGPQYRVGSHRQFVLFARAFAAEGYPVLRFDHRGIGDCPGAPRAFSELNTDIRSAVDALLRLYPGLEGVVLLGLCDAATACMIYADTDPRVTGLVLLNPWVRQSATRARISLLHYYRQRLLQKGFWRKIARRETKVSSALAELATVARSAFFRNSSSAEGSEYFLRRMWRGLSVFSGKVRFILSGSDLTAKEFMSFCKSRESDGVMRRDSITIDLIHDADHTFTRALDRHRAIEGTLVWLDTVRPSG